MQIGCRTLELFLKLWRRNRDEASGAFSEVAAMQRRNAILSDDVMDVRA